MKEYYTPSTIVQIVVGGDRSQSVHDKAASMSAPGSLSRAFTRCLNFLDRFEPPEDADSIRSADRHLSAIGYLPWQRSLMRAAVNAVVEHHLKENLRVQDFYPMTRLLPSKDEAVQFNDRFHLGVHLGGQSLSMRPSLIRVISKDLTETLDRIRNVTPGFLITGQAQPDLKRPPIATHRAMPR